MPLKKGKKGKRKGKKSGKKARDTSAKKADPVANAYHVPPPPLPFENLVSLLKERRLNARELFGVQISDRALKKLTPQEISDMKFIFETFDGNQDGLIRKKELKIILKILNFQSTNYEVDRIYESCTVESEGKNGLDFNDFLDVVLQKQGDARDVMGELEAGFGWFDLDGEGRITADNLKDLSQNVGLFLSKAEISDMIEEADVTGDGCVNVNEFIRIMRMTPLFEDDEP